MSKQEMRKRLAALSFSEKVKILEKLRDRSLALAIVRVSLVTRRSILNSSQEEMREKLESEVQKNLSVYLKGSTPNSSRTFVYASLRAWLEGYGQVRFELNIDGKLRSAEVHSVDELGRLVGEGQTAGTLLRALGQKVSASGEPNSEE